MTEKSLQKDWFKSKRKNCVIIIEDLKLNDAQVAKFDALNKEFYAKIEFMKQNADMSKEDYKEKKTALKKEKEAAFLQLLTSEQQIKYKEMLEKKNAESKSQASNKPAQQ